MVTSPSAVFLLLNPFFRNFRESGTNGRRYYTMDRHFDLFHSRPIMIRRSAAVLMLLLTAAFASTAHGGIVQTLPKDGIWTSYYTEMTSETQADQGITGIMTVRSVGSVEEDGEKCRWIEIEMKGTQKNGDKQNSIMKFLVREKDFKAGAKGTPKILRGWTKNNDQDIKELSEMELAGGTINLILVGKAKDAKTVKKEKTIDYQKGQLKIATAVTGHPELKLGGENAPPDFKYNVKQTTWLHKKVPFGMAARELQIEIKVKDKIAAKMTMSFTVQDYGTGAKSACPDKK